MGFFSRRKSKSRTAAESLMHNLIESPLGLWAITHRARITLGISPAESKPSDSDVAVSWEQIADLTTKTVLFAAKQSWLGESGNRDSEVFVLAIMNHYIAFLAQQATSLSQEDRMLIEMAFSIDLENEFCGEVPSDRLEIGALGRDAELAVSQAMRTTGGQQHFRTAASLVEQFWSTGHPVDASRLGKHFEGLLKATS